MTALDESSAVHCLTAVKRDQCAYNFCTPLSIENSLLKTTQPLLVGLFSATKIIKSSTNQLTSKRVWAFDPLITQVRDGMKSWNAFKVYLLWFRGFNVVLPHLCKSNVQQNSLESQKSSHIKRYFLVPEVSLFLSTINILLFTWLFLILLLFFSSPNWPFRNLFYQPTASPS